MLPSVIFLKSGAKSRIHDSKLHVPMLLQGSAVGSNSRLQESQHNAHLIRGRINYVVTTDKKNTSPIWPVS